MARVLLIVGADVFGSGVWDGRVFLVRVVAGNWRVLFGRGEIGCCSLVWAFSWWLAVWVLFDWLLVRDCLVSDWLAGAFRWDCWRLGFGAWFWRVVVALV